MHTPVADPSRGAVFHVDRLVDDPSDPLLCFLARGADGMLLATINEAHGLRGWEHATGHARAGFRTATIVCLTDRACGYREAGPAGWPERPRAWAADD